MNGPRLNKLSANYVLSEKLAPGRHSDGGGLCLNVAKTGAKSWLFMWVSGGKRSEMGLGSATKGGKAETITLKQARDRVDEIRLILGGQGDPFKQASWRKAERKEETFGAAADAYIASMEAGCKNEIHRDQWEITLGDAYCASIRPLPVEKVTTEQILSILLPIWLEKVETASKLRGRIEKVLDFAKAQGMALRA